VIWGFEKVEAYGKSVCEGMELELLQIYFCFVVDK
jgi:hypothetical protein